MNTNNSLEKLAVTAEELHTDLKSEKPLLVFDLRLKEHFTHGHIDGSVHVVCDSRAKETIIPRIPKGVKIVLIDEDGTISSETASMMTSYGLDAHFLKDGIKSWNKSLVKKDAYAIIAPEELWSKIKKKEELVLLDVRQPDEFLDFKISGSINIPLSELFNKDSLDKIPKDKQVVTICPHGNRSMVAVFALARNGIDAVSLTGGLADWGQVLNSQIVTREKVTILQVEKIGKGCLSYIVGSKGEAIVIDPVYPAEKYVEFARNEGLQIVKVIDTHQHADHVSAAHDLAKLTSSKLYMSKYEQYDFESNRIGDADIINIGESKIMAIHTPGHTGGSMSFLLDEKYVFTGDILFVEGIGRPDLRNKAKEFANDLYDTLHNKLLALPNETVVLPAHHGEQVVSKNDIYYTSIKEVRGLSILELSHDIFIDKVVGMIFPRPMNYEKIIQMNKSSQPVPISEVANLEIGPNRCAISTA
jgi:glyoxylase-like metal-dependent hydrolase (beta-lactamase superfamily II)/rhodanese-related sulfurtransferase